MNIFRYKFVFSFLSVLLIISFKTSLAQINVSLPQVVRPIGSPDEYVNITVGNITTQDNITSFQFDVFYDTSVVYISNATNSGSTVSGVSGGLFFANPNYSPGDLRAAFASENPISGSGILAQLQLHYKNPGVSSLSFTNPSNSQNTFKFNTGTPAAVITPGQVSVQTVIPTLTVTSPNGGENWQALSVHNITWTSSNVTNVKIDYTLNNGTNWVTIIASTPAASGTYSWTLPDTSSTTAKVRITDASNGSTGDTSNAVFTITPLPKVNIISPNGGENWLGNSIHNITWSSVSITNVKIEYTLDNGTTWSTIIASTPASADTYSWTLPNVPSTQAKVRISDASNASVGDSSNAVFTITAVSLITVVSPNGGETWIGNSSHSITWTSANVTNVKIEFTLDNGTTWSTITASTAASSGTYSWTVPNVGSTLAKVRISDAGNPATADTSNAAFTISAEVVTVVSPNGGEIWLGNSVHNITWTSVNVTNVKIEFTLDNGTTWSTITASTAASSGTYSWTVPNVGSTLAKVRISDAGNPATADTSNAAFTIANVVLTVVSPNGGETWIGNSVHSIVWTSANVTNVKIEYTLDNGTSWSTISASTAASTGTFNWTVPNVSSNQAKVRISDASNASEGDTSNAAFTISTQSITVISPNGGETWLGNSVNNITWTSSNVTNVIIEYTLDNGTTWSIISSSTAASTGSYSWTIPDTSSTQAKIRISDLNNSNIGDTSNSSFTITKAPRITVAAPNGGEVWQGKSSHVIMWTSVSVTNVKIEYSLDNGISWINIAASTPANAGSYSWTLPDTSSAQSKVRITDASNPSIGDTSNNVFAITYYPKIVVTSPNGGENWVGKSVHNITWTSLSVSNVKIELTLDNGASWSIVSSSTPSNGIFSWTVPDTLSTLAKVRISDVTNAAINGVSSGTFNINFAPRIFITSPNGGEDWQAKTTHDIMWTSINVDSVKIEYSLDAGGNWSMIISRTSASTGKYTWVLPDTSSAQVLIRISSAIDASVYSTSSNVFTISPVTGIDDYSSGQPKVFSLYQNYPNPFNPSTNIDFAIPKESKVILKVYNLLGQEVATLVNQELTIGRYKYQFIADRLSSGIYIYRLQAGDHIFIKKMTLLK